jgi:L-seryl-tRNA(Ser) seleniumtransferase
MTPITTRRDLPQVDALAGRFDGLAPSPVLRDAARAVIDAARQGLEATTPTTVEALEADLVDRIVSQSPLRTLVNATGVLLHTNLGRAPLGPLDEPPLGAVPLEIDLASGERGNRFAAIETALRVLTGAEAALVVNNNAAALLLALSSLAAGREVIVSRGQLVEIGGEFRIPEIVVQGGAVLREVGTTNRTHGRDIEGALSEQTAVVLEVHPSNFEVVGFVASVPTVDLASIAHAAGAVLVADLGSGLLDDRCPWLDSAPTWLAGEPGARQALEAGADVITFSGDKLLGGPQAGVICGRAALVERMRRHPLARALRFDKTRAGFLQAALDAYLTGTARATIPFWSMAGASAGELAERATAVAGAIVERVPPSLATVDVVDTTDAVGAGAAAARGLPGSGIAVTCAAGPQQLARELRRATPPVVGTERGDAVVLALRAVPARQDDLLVAAVATAVVRGRPRP